MKNSKFLLGYISNQISTLIKVISILYSFQNIDENPFRYHRNEVKKCDNTLFDFRKRAFLPLRLKLSMF